MRQKFDASKIRSARMPKACFKMVKYHSKEYPNDIPLGICELATHVDIDKIAVYGENYSLHTEYSYGKRNFSSVALKGLDEIINSNRDGVPQLWKNKKWAEQFAEFVIRMSSTNCAPSVIEIHPPFSDYVKDIMSFVAVYSEFEKIIADEFSQTDIFIENRCGSVYKGGRFVISKFDDIYKLSEAIDEQNLRLSIALDIPQLFTAHNFINDNAENCVKLLSRIMPIRHNISCVHLWGKRRAQSGRTVAHCGDLKSYFDNDIIIIKKFLDEFVRLFSDGIIRKLVLEVNSSNKDLMSIIYDLEKAGVNFV